MPEAHKKQSSWTSFFFGLMVICAVALMLVISPSYMERLYLAERSSVQTLIGDAEEEVYEAAYVAPSDDVQNGLDSISRDLGEHKPISAWAGDRVVAAWIWGNLISYRMVMLFAWMLSFLPLILAAFIDGYYVREARKYTFYSQSPIRHKVGVRTAVSVCGLAAVSIFVPLAIPPIVAPLALTSVGAAGWLWMSNLQKRL